MKRTFAVAVAISLLFVLSASAAALTIEADAGYLLGFGEFKSAKPVHQGFAVNAKAEVIPNLMVDGTFLSVRAVKSEDEDVPEEGPVSEQLMAAGVLYRVITDEDLWVFAGGGFLDWRGKAGGAEADALNEKGLYGKVGFKFIPHPQFDVVLDLSYAPKLKDDGGTFLSAQGRVGYQISEGLGVQFKAVHYQFSDSDHDTGNTLIGGGIVVSF